MKTTWRIEKRLSEYASEDGKPWSVRGRWSHAAHHFKTRVAAERWVKTRKASLIGRLKMAGTWRANLSGVRIINRFLKKKTGHYYAIEAIILDGRAIGIVARASGGFWATRAVFDKKLRHVGTYSSRSSRMKAVFALAKKGGR